MAEEKIVNLHKINREENEKIVQLIKTKLTPMHQKHRVFPKMLSPIDMNKIPMLREVPFFKAKKQILLKEKHLRHQSLQIPLVQKANLHIQEQKKMMNDEEIKQLKAKMSRISLGSYIHLFSSFGGMDERRQDSQFIRLKKQSQLMSMPTLASENVQKTLIKDCQKQLSEEDICLMNAKYRKQMNHRKLIGISKIKNRT